MLHQLEELKDFSFNFLIGKAISVKLNDETPHLFLISSVFLLIRPGSSHTTFQKQSHTRQPWRTGYTYY